MPVERVRVIQSGSRSQTETLLPVEERRGSPRISTRTAGLVYPSSHAAAIPCTITDISGTGARLELLAGWINPYRAPASVGEKFKLVMRIDRLEVNCEIVHIAENVMGVLFVSTAQPLPRKI